MAFGSIRSLGRGRDQAAVRLVADTGEFNAKVEAAERQWRESVAGMSREALKLDLAQDRLRRSLDRYGAESNQAKRATIGLKDAEDAAARSAQNLDRRLDQTHRRTFALRGSVVALAASLGGVYGLVSVLRQSKDVATNLEEQINKVGVTFGAAAVDVVEWSRTSATSLGIARDEALAYAGTLGQILKAAGLTGDATSRLARELVELAADMASFNNASPEDTLRAIRSGLTGEIEPLRRYGVLLSEAASRQEALRVTGKKSAQELTQGEKVLARYRLILQQTTDQQGDYARTADGTANTERTLQALWRDTQGMLGGAILPAYTRVIGSIRDYLASGENQEELQQRVNRAVEAGGQVLHGFAAVLRTVKSAVDPVVDALGGLENATKFLVAGLLLRRIGLLRVGIAGIGPAAVSSAAGLTAMGAAADASAIKVGRLATLARGLNVASVAGFAAVLGAQFLHDRFDEPNRITADQLKDPEVRARIREAVGADGLAKLDQALTLAQGIGARPEEGRAARDAAAGAPQARRGGRSGTPTAATSLPRSLSDAELRAGLTADPRDDLAAARDTRAFWRRQLALAKEGTEEYSQILRDLVAANGRVESLEGQIAAEQQRHLDELKRKREGAAERLQRKTDRLNDLAARNAARINKAIRESRRALRAGELGVEGTRSTAMVERQQVNAMIREVLVEFERVQRANASNLRQPVVVQQTFQTQAPPGDPADVFRGARYARWAARAAIEG